MRKILGLALGLSGLLAIAACETPPSTQELVEQGALVPMTTDEIMEAVNGNSEIWIDHGAGFYQEDGVFKGHWDGDGAEGTWWVENDVRCYDVEEWGGEWCHEFYRQDGEIVLVRQGTSKILPNRIEEGNKL